MDREELLKKLDYSSRKYGKSLLERFKNYPFITLRDAVITILFNKIFKNKFYFRIKAKTFFGEDMYVIFPENKDILFYRAYVYTNPELRLTKFILKNIHKDNLIFFDLGAHYGYYSLLISKILPNSKIYAFEPDPGVLEILELNKRNNIFIVPKGVSDENGYLEFYSMPILSSGVSTFDRSHLTHLNLKIFKKIKVPVITLDKFSEENNVRPDFIKIDVEGYEEKVLKGAQQILSNHNPIIVMEIFLDLGDNYRNAVNILENLGYSMFYINQDGEINKLEYDNIVDYAKKQKEFYKSISDSSIFDNLIFLK